MRTVITVCRRCIRILLKLVRLAEHLCCLANHFTLNQNFDCRSFVYGATMWSDQLCVERDLPMHCLVPWVLEFLPDCMPLLGQSIQFYWETMNFLEEWFYESTTISWKIYQGFKNKDVKFCMNTIYSHLFKYKILRMCDTSYTHPLGVIRINLEPLRAQTGHSQKGRYLKILARAHMTLRTYMQHLSWMKVVPGIVQ
jgi:hypothetical protein